MLGRLIAIWLVLCTPALADGALIIASGLLGPFVVPVLGIALANELRAEHRWRGRLLAIPAALWGFFSTFALLADQLGDPRYGPPYLLLVFGAGFAAGTVPSFMLLRAHQEAFLRESRLMPNAKGEFEQSASDDTTEDAEQISQNRKQYAHRG